MSVVSITAVQARGLWSRTGEVNAYCEIRIEDESHKTRIFKKDNNPKWNETFSFKLSSTSNDVAAWLKCWSVQETGGEEFLGCVKIPIRDVKQNPLNWDKWLDLAPLHVASGDLNQSSAQGVGGAVTGALHVCITTKDTPTAGKGNEGSVASTEEPEPAALEGILNKTFTEFAKDKQEWSNFLKLAKRYAVQMQALSELESQVVAEFEKISEGLSKHYVGTAFADLAVMQKNVAAEHAKLGQYMQHKLVAPLIAWAETDEKEHQMLEKKIRTQFREYEEEETKLAASARKLTKKSLKNNAQKVEELKAQTESLNRSKRQLVNHLRYVQSSTYYEWTWEWMTYMNQVNESLLTCSTHCGKLSTLKKSLKAQSPLPPHNWRTEEYPFLTFEARAATRKAKPAIEGLGGVGHPGSGTDQSASSSLSLPGTSSDNLGSTATGVHKPRSRSKRKKDLEEPVGLLPKPVSVTAERPTATTYAILGVHVVEARDIQPGPSGVVDSFATCMFYEKKGQKQPRASARTRTIDKTSNPQWNQLFEFNMGLELRGAIELVVTDLRRDTKEEIVGFVSISIPKKWKKLKNKYPHIEAGQWIQLEGKNTTAELRIALSYRGYDSNSSEPAIVLPPLQIATPSIRAASHNSPTHPELALPLPPPPAIPPRQATDLPPPLPPPPTTPTAPFPGSTGGGPSVPLPMSPPPLPPPPTTTPNNNNTSVGPPPPLPQREALPLVPLPVAVPPPIPASHPPIAETGATHGVDTLRGALFRG